MARRRVPTNERHRRQEFGVKVRQTREMLNLSQKEFGDVFGYNTITISRIERGDSYRLPTNTKLILSQLIRY